MLDVFIGSIRPSGSWQDLAGAPLFTLSMSRVPSSCHRYGFDKSWSDDHLETLDITGVGCAAALKTCSFQLLFKFKYMINKLVGFVIAHKG